MAKWVTLGNGIHICDTVKEKYFGVFQGKECNLGTVVEGECFATRMYIAVIGYGPTSNRTIELWYNGSLWTSHSDFSNSWHEIYAYFSRSDGLPLMAGEWEAKYYDGGTEVLSKKITITPQSRKFIVGDTVQDTRDPERIGTISVISTAINTYACISLHPYQESHPYGWSFYFDEEEHIIPYDVPDVPSHTIKVETTPRVVLRAKIGDSPMLTHMPQGATNEIEFPDGTYDFSIDTIPDGYRLVSTSIPEGTFNLSEDLTIAIELETFCTLLDEKPGYACVDGGWVEEPAPRPPPCGSYGDVDGDGMVSYADHVMAATKFVAGLITLTQDQILRADVNGDRMVDLADVLLIGRYVFGLEDTFPVCDVSDLCEGITCDDVCIGADR